MVLTASFALSPVTGLVCHRRLRIESTDLTPASGRQDHTTSPSAASAFVKGAARVHRVPPRVRDDREPPLSETGRLIFRIDFSNGKSGIFFASGLDIHFAKLVFDLPGRQSPLACQCICP
jgi:hypothetical protein